MLDAPASNGLGETGLRNLAALAAELGDLKRVRDAANPLSVASRQFRRGWAALIGGADLRAVALQVAADTLAAARLGGIDAALLARAGLDRAAARDVLARGLDEVAGPLDADLHAALRGAVGQAMVEPAHLPGFVDALVRQPRAGATCPGKPRIMLEPPEGHGDHCLLVAVLGVLLAPRYGADVGDVFLAGMAHHLHNAVLPDSGFAGEMLLGDHLQPIMRRLFDEALATLPDTLAAEARRVLACIGDAENPLGRAFNAADVIDRVQEMHHFAKVADFAVDQALDDLDLVHEGPVQQFHFQVMQEAGLR